MTSLQTLLVLVALAASLVALTQTQARAFPLAAVIIAGLQALLVFGWVSLAVRGVSVGLVLGAGLVIAGLGTWNKATTKLAVSCAAIVALVGGVQVARLLL